MPKLAIPDLNNWGGMYDCLSHAEVSHADLEAFQSRHVRGYGLICCFPSPPWIELVRNTTDE